jgi:hypothetical protein
MRTRKSTMVLVAVALAVLGASVAWAQSAKFVKKYKGQLFVSDQEFQVIDDDAAMSDQIKKNSKSSLEGTQGEDAKSWDFYWIAVLSKKPGSANATIFFYEVTGKTKKQVTYKDIGIDGEQVVIVSNLSISEDDGLTKGKKYELVLATTSGNKQNVLAKGQVTLK